jgi:DNA gyrase subunit B
LASWQNTTHDWAVTADAGHLGRVRRDPAVFAPGGVVHLVLEVLAYAADEAQHTGAGRAVVTVYEDGSVSVADGGRGTDTRTDHRGQVIRKPVMATRDLRFFDALQTEVLPDGHPRRGMSVVTALSAWLVHTSWCRDGAWTQRYEYGRPVTDLMPIAGNGTTGTNVHFLTDNTLLQVADLPAAKLRQLALGFGPALAVKVT